jgi:hypothetical protein
MEERNQAPYLVKREAQRWVVVPSPMFVSLMIGAFGAGSAFLLYLSSLFLRHAGASSANLWLGAILLLVASLSAGLGIRAWRTRRTTLNIEFSGRVSYGERELCAAGSVQAVRIGPSRGGEAGDCAVCMELAEGKLVSVPSQCFSGIKAREHARAFAAELAEALGVRVMESR